MGTISKLFVTAILIAIIIGMWQLGVWDKSPIAFAIIGLLCVGGGAKMWLD